MKAGKKGQKYDGGCLFLLLATRFKGRGRESLYQGEKKGAKYCKIRNERHLCAEHNVDVDEDLLQQFETNEKRYFAYLTRSIKSSSATNSRSLLANWPS